MRKTLRRWKYKRRMYILKAVGRSLGYETMCRYGARRGWVKKAADNQLWLADSPSSTRQVFRSVTAAFRGGHPKEVSS